MSETKEKTYWNPASSWRTVLAFALTAAFGGMLYSANLNIQEAIPLDTQKAGIYGLVGLVIGTALGVCQIFYEKLTKKPTTQKKEVIG
jgi:hypothetical protein